MCVCARTHTRATWTCMNGVRAVLCHQETNLPPFFFVFKYFQWVSHWSGAHHAASLCNDLCLRLPSAGTKTVPLCPGILMLVWGIKLLSQACAANSLPTNLPPMPCFSSFKKVVRRIGVIIADFTVSCGVRSQEVRHPSICGGWFLSAWLGRGASWVMRHHCERFCEGIFE